VADLTPTDEAHVHVWNLDFCDECGATQDSRAWWDGWDKGFLDGKSVPEGYLLVRASDVLTLDDAGVERLAEAQHAACEQEWRERAASGAVAITMHSVETHQPRARAIVERLRG
jgi:hypothetical protein